MPDNPLDIRSFAAQIKAKYPDYQDVDDYELASKTLEKYPDYKEVVFAPANNGRYSINQLQDTLRLAGWDEKEIPTMAAIGWHEGAQGSPKANRRASGAQNPSGLPEDSIGPWQINWLAHGKKLQKQGINREDLFDPFINAKAARQIYDEAKAKGIDPYRPWGGYTDKNYRKYLGMSRKAYEQWQSQQPSAPALIPQQPTEQTAQAAPPQPGTASSAPTQRFKVSPPPAVPPVITTPPAAPVPAEEPAEVRYVPPKPPEGSVPGTELSKGGGPDALIKPFDVERVGPLAVIGQAGPEAQQVYLDFVRRNAQPVKGKPVNVEAAAADEVMAQTFVQIQDYLEKSPDAKPQEQTKALAQMGLDFLKNPATKGQTLPKILHAAMLSAEWTPEEEQSLPKVLQSQRSQQRAAAAPGPRVSTADAAWHFGMTPDQARKLSPKQRQVLAQAVADDEKKRAAGQSIAPPPLSYQNEMRRKAGIAPLKFNVPTDENEVSPYYKPESAPIDLGMEDRAGFAAPKETVVDRFIGRIAKQRKPQLSIGDVKQRDDEEIKAQGILREQIRKGTAAATPLPQVGYQDLGKPGIAEQQREQIIEQRTDAQLQSVLAQRSASEELARQQRVAGMSTGEKLKSAGGAFVQGLAEIPASAGDTQALIQSVPVRALLAAGRKLGITDKSLDAADLPTAQFADFARRKIAETFPEHADLKDEFILSQVPKGMGSAIGFFGPGLIAKSATLVPALLGISVGASQGYRDAKAHGATENQALVSAVLNGGVGASEAIPTAKWIRRLDRASAGTFSRSFGQFLKEAGKESIEEASQEFFQSVAGNVIAAKIIAYDKERGILDGAFESAGAGAIIGGLMSAGTQTIARTTQKQSKPQDKLQDVIAPTLAAPTFEVDKKPDKTEVQNAVQERGPAPLPVVEAPKDRAEVGGRAPGEQPQPADARPGAISLAPAEGQVPVQSEAEIAKPASPTGLQPAPGIARVPTSQLNVDPERFQYKLNPDAKGATGSLSDVGAWNPDLAGTVMIWHDPADGKDYVVNGHNRYALASRTGQTELDVRYINAPDAQAARARGALVNIAEGQGTVLDAAKFFRDSGHTPEDLTKQGISLKRNIARDGLALSKLNPFVFNQVVQGELSEEYGVQIGNKISNVDLQDQALKAIKTAEAKGRQLSKGVVDEMLDAMTSAPREVETEQTLFGDITSERSLFTERAQVAAAIKRQLAADKTLFGTAARKSERLAEGGTVVDVEQAKALKESAAEAAGIFDTLKNRSGEISDILDEGARSVANGKRPDQVAKENYEKIKSAVKTLLGKGAPGERGGSEAAAGRSEGASGQRSLVEPAIEETQDELDRVLVEIPRQQVNQVQGEARFHVSARANEILTSGVIEPAGAGGPNFAIGKPYSKPTKDEIVFSHKGAVGSRVLEDAVGTPIEGSNRPIRLDDPKVDILYRNQKGDTVSVKDAYESGTKTTAELVEIGKSRMAAPPPAQPETAQVDLSKTPAPEDSRGAQPLISPDIARMSTEAAQAELNAGRTPIGTENVIPGRQTEGEIEESAEGFGPGAMKAGEPLPEVKERKFGKRFTADEEIAAEIRESIGTAKYYNPIPNKLTAKQAKELVEERGVGETIQIVKDEKNSLEPRIRSTMGQIVIKRMNEAYKNLKETNPEEAEFVLDQAVDLAEWQMDFGTRLGQGVQSFAMWARLTPEGKLLGYRRSVEQARKRLRELTGDEIPDIIKAVNKAVREVHEGTVKELAEIIRNMLSKAKPDSPVWQQYKDAMARQLANYVDPKVDTKPPLQEFTNRLLQNVKGLIQVERQKGSKLDPYDELREVVENWDKYQEAWGEATQFIRAKYEDHPSELAAIEQRITDLDSAFRTKAFDKVMEDAISQAQINFRTLARSHVSERIRTRDELIQDIQDRLGIKLSKEEAAQLIDRATQKIAMKLVRTREAILKQMVAAKNKTARKILPLADRIVEAARLGVFNEQQFYEAAGERLGLPPYNSDVAKTILEHAGRIEDAPEGMPRDQATLALTKFIAEQKGFGWQDLPVGIYYGNILSGYNTHIVNAVDTFLNVVSEINGLAMRNPLAAAKIYGGLLKGFNEGRLDALLSLTEGRMVTDGKWLETPRLMEMAKFGKKGGVPIQGTSRISRAAKRVAESKIGYPLNAYKYVTRLLVASDSLMHRGAREARAALIAHKIAQGEGLKGAALENRAREILGAGSMSAFRAQAEREGFTGVMARVRANELRDLLREPDVMADAMDFAGEATYNHEPHGLLGYFSKQISNASETYKPLKLFVPFSRIVANVTNRGLNWTPYGFKRVVVGYSGEAPLSGEARSQMLIRATLGTIGMGLLWTLQSQGLLQIHGAGPSDWEKKKQLQGAGWRPYSLQIGDAYIPYVYTPIGLGLSVIGNASDSQRYHELEQKDAATRAAYAVARVGSTVFNQSFLSGLSRLFSALSDRPEVSVTAIKQTISSTAQAMTTPILAKDIYKLFDNKAYQSNTLMEDLVRNTPFAALVLRPQLNAFGETVRVQRQRFLDVMTSDPAWRFVIKKGLKVPVPGRTIEIEKDRRITPEEYYELVKATGPQIKKWLLDHQAELEAKTESEAQDDLSNAATSIRKAYLEGMRARAQGKSIKALQREQKRENRQERPERKRDSKDIKRYQVRPPGTPTPSPSPAAQSQTRRYQVSPR